MNESGGDMLTMAGALERTEELLDGVALDLRQENGCLVVEVEGQDLPEAARRLRDDEQLSFKYLSHISGIDNVDHLETVCLLRSLDHPVLVELRVKITDRKHPVVPTLSHLWSGANWHERETYDLFGIRFEGHPDLRRILNREDLDVYPYRKDTRPQRKTRPEWRWPGLASPRRLPGEPHRRERS